MLMGVDPPSFFAKMPGVDIKNGRGSTGNKIKIFNTYIYFKRIYICKILNII